MPLTQLRDGKLQKKVKNGKKRHLLSNFIFFVVFFFFPVKSCFFFFFPGKVYPSLTHSISEGGKKKTASEKKKNTIFTHSLEKHQKGANFNLFRVKKKYGTFGLTVPIR